MLGNMYFFFYQPKLSESLPYYDTFPLVIPIEAYNDGFLGINFHYLPHRYRAILLDRLLDLKAEDSDYYQDRLDWTKIMYEKLDGRVRYKYFKPCIKRYLFSQVQSRFLEVEMQDWTNAVFLPVERFEKEKAVNVWEESRRKANRYAL
tara:strand:+ start:42671 stop:43114 length:444 start_codon:yes stop_codon:yes gene_type:complete